MSSMESIRQFCDNYLQTYAQLDVLIHNAANFDPSQKEPVLTVDGIETVFATNHIGVFLMTHLLLKIMQTSAPSRVITVASKGLMMYPRLDIEFDNLNGERRYSMQHAYYHSKLAQVMFTFDLAERLKETGVNVNCVRVTNVAIPEERLSHLPGLLKKVYSLKRKMSISPEKQAETYVYLAADPELINVTGGYWDENKKLVHASPKSYNPVTWKKLWEASSRLAGLD
jgi:NAD(P)-dependent dehydrogenase (short-subunit alcohol dehydrogenase family)